jgi:hypothetical protein
MQSRAERSSRTFITEAQPTLLQRLSFIKSYSTDHPHAPTYVMVVNEYPIARAQETGSPTRPSYESVLHLCDFRLIGPRRCADPQSRCGVETKRRKHRHPPCISYQSTIQEDQATV